jgi:hypothetical protein
MTDQTPKLDIAAAIAAIEPDPAKQKAIIEQLVAMAVSRLALPPSAVAQSSVEPPRFAGVPAERGAYGPPGKATAAMAAAVGDDLIRSIMADHRVPVTLPSIPSATVRVVGAPEVVTGNDGAKHSIDGWRPPGDRVFGALMDQEDRLWRAQRAKELGEAVAGMVKR